MRQHQAEAPVRECGAKDQVSRVGALLAAMLVAALVVSGCAKTQTQPPMKPKVTPPLIGKSGVLRAGVDTRYPPFAGLAGNRVVGIDVDVAAALAENLGLDLELIDMRADDVGTVLKEHRADIALGATPITEAILSDATFAGSYLADAPGFFAAKDASASLDTVGDRVVSVQEGSAAYWILKPRLRPERLLVFPTLREALNALKDGRADLAAGDAIVGAYIDRDMPGVRFVGQIADAMPLGIAVSREATGFEPIVRTTLDGLAGSGVLDTIRAKWVGDLRPVAIEASGTGTPAP